MNNSSKKEKGERIRRKSKKEKKGNKKGIEKKERSSSKAALTKAKKQQDKINTKHQQNSKKLNKESEGKITSVENNFQAKETLGKKEKRDSIPAINSKDILFDNQTEVKSKYLQRKRKRILPKKAKEKKKEPKENEEVSMPIYEPEGQYTLRKRKEDERIDFNLINCHQCHLIGMLNQMLTCRNERCRDSYCFNCIQKYYIKNASKLNLLTMRLGSWKCFKCKNECKCETCSVTKTSVSQEIPQQKISISIEPKKRTKSRIIRRTRIIQPKRPKTIPKVKPNIIIIHGMPIVEMKEDTHSFIENNDPLLLPGPIPAWAFNNNPKPYIPLQLNKKEKQLLKVSNLCESLNLENNKRLKRKCLFCFSDSLQSNETLVFLTLKEFFDYLNYLLTCKASTMCYNQDLFQQNIQDLTRYCKKELAQKQTPFCPQIICKGCMLIKLNQPKFIKCFINKKNLEKKKISKLSNLSNLTTQGNETDMKKWDKNSLCHLNEKQTNNNSKMDNSNKEQSCLFFNDANTENIQTNRKGIPSLSFNEELNYCITEMDVGKFLNYNQYFHESMQKLTYLIDQLNSESNSNSLTLDRINDYACNGSILYQSYRNIYICYAQNQTILSNNINQLVQSISNNPPNFQDLHSKILETKKEFEIITNTYIDLLRYIDDSVHSFMGMLNWHSQFLLLKSKEMQQQQPQDNNNS